jgi:hypothetical protein
VGEAAVTAAQSLPARVPRLRAWLSTVRDGRSALTGHLEIRYRIAAAARSLHTRKDFACLR